MKIRNIIYSGVVLLAFCLLMYFFFIPSVVAYPDHSADINNTETVHRVDTEPSNKLTENYRPEGWSEETHGKSADPDYDVVFPQDEVNVINIMIDPADWQIMMDDMTDRYGEFGVRELSQAHRGENIPAGRGLPDAGFLPPPIREGGPVPPQFGDGNHPPMGQNELMGGIDDNPIWIPVTIEFRENTWTHAGLRFKGNSSLRDTWGNGILKLPLKLDFDEFENDYPEIDDQRFYGFKQLTLSSNFLDDSFLREKVTADIFREAGIPSAHTTFYRVYVDYGEGPIYFGLYTMVEVVDDTVIEEQFENDDGNVYKPDGWGASFAEDSFSELMFDKETNQDEADWSDILTLFDILHSDQRTQNPSVWRSNLESVFNVDVFLKWLAVNILIQNWDSYGLTIHNYYLYNDPATGLLTWIPWDNNMAMRDDIGHFRVLSLSLMEVNDNWPLIRYLMDDEIYHAQYVANLEETINGAFEPGKMIETYQQLHNLIQPYVTGTEGEIADHTLLRSPGDFDTALNILIDHVSCRYNEATLYIESQRKNDS